jgi:methionine-gamma-lyase
MGEKGLLGQIREYGIVHLGACISPFNAWLIMRGLVTLPLRMEKHSKNALRIARFLQTQEKVDLVTYPGLPDHPQHEIARRQMSGYSGMLNFRLDVGLLENFAFIEKLKMIRHAVSLGHDQTLIYYLPTMFFFEDMVILNDQQKEVYGKSMGEGIFRLSVGIENPDDLIEDLSQAIRTL